jgi:hypothetical protein
MASTRYKLARVSGTPVSDAELLNDLMRVAAETGSRTVSQPVYRKQGTYDDTTISRRFGSWNSAVRAAGLSVGNEVNIEDEQLFENLLRLWQRYGRQPRRRELANPPSIISQSPYLRRFGSWTKALQCFIDFANGAEAALPSNTASSADGPTGRDPSLRLRYQVMKRDRFCCQQCGASPAKASDVELHIDHITPWSKGGRTVLDNLRTLCSGCNLGKGDLM